MKSLLNLATALVVAGAFALPAMAQAPGGGGGFGGGGPGGGGGFGGGGPGGGGGGFGGGGGGFGGGGGGRGGFGAQAPQDRADAMRDSLGEAGDAKNDEWKVLSAKIVKVLEDQQQVNAGAARGGFGGRAGGRGGRGGRGGGGAGGGGGFGGGGGGFGGGAPGGAPGGAAAASNPLVTANAALSEAVTTTQPATADADLKSKLQAVRDARSKLEGQLKTDQADLQKVTNIRQEAYLVSQGILE